MTDRSSPRLRGRAGQERRKRMLIKHPLCVMCKAEGVYTPTDEIDHTTPLNQGGADDETNLQGLCFMHHQIKTASEEGYRVSNHPDWLQPSAIPLTIVCGPPCSGKTTHVRTNAGNEDIIIDLDDIMTSIDPDYQPWTGNRDCLDQAIRMRNRTLGALSRSNGEDYDRAWFVVSAPTQAERDWWQDKLGGELILLDPGIEECKRRAVQRGTPAAIAGIDDWHRRSRLPWLRKQAKAVIGLDGWPNETG